MAPDPNIRCARCGWRKSTHAVVTSVAGEPVLICPIVIFDETTGPSAHANAVDEELKQKT